MLLVLVQARPPSIEKGWRRMADGRCALDAEAGEPKSKSLEGTASAPRRLHRSRNAAAAALPAGVPKETVVESKGNAEAKSPGAACGATESGLNTSKSQGMAAGSAPLGQSVRCLPQGGEHNRRRI